MRSVQNIAVSVLTRVSHTHTTAAPPPKTPPHGGPRENPEEKISAEPKIISGAEVPKKPGFVFPIRPWCLALALHARYFLPRIFCSAVLRPAVGTSALRPRSGGTRQDGPPPRLALPAPIQPFLIWLACSLGLCPFLFGLYYILFSGTLSYFLSIFQASYFSSILFSSIPKHLIFTLSYFYLFLSYFHSRFSFAHPSQMQESGKYQCANRMRALPGTGRRGPWCSWPAP